MPIAALRGDQSSCTPSPSPVPFQDARQIDPADALLRVALVPCEGLGEGFTLLVLRGVSYAAGYCAYTTTDSGVPSATAPPHHLAILPSSSSDIPLHSEGTHKYI